MPKHVWIIASGLAALVLVGLLGVSCWMKDRELEQTRNGVEEAWTRLSNAEAIVAQTRETLPTAK
jgi:hypothetical protein